MEYDIELSTVFFDSIERELDKPNKNNYDKWKKQHDMDEFIRNNSLKESIKLKNARKKLIEIYANGYYPGCERDMRKYEAIINDYAKRNKRHLRILLNKRKK